ncbi:MAG: SpoIIE family protein phosphatase [Thermoanaerobaculum sp.]|nr:SpoIIE family protein phosphatase [Thermoanaerobaculum sp.]
MSVHDLLGLLHQGSQWGSKQVPQRALEHLLASTGACGGQLVHGGKVLVEVGQPAGAELVHRLPAGREGFQLTLWGGKPPGEELLLAAGTVLSAWALREELRASRFAERRRLWEVESLRAMAEVLGGKLDVGDVGQSLLFQSMALLDARRGELWLARDLCEGQEICQLTAAPLCVAERVGEAILAPDQVSSLHGSMLVGPGVMAAPIGTRERLLGVLALADREARGGFTSFTTKDLETLTLFAAQGALAFSAILAYRQRVAQQLLEQELSLAASVQKHLLPDLPRAVGGWQVAALCNPSRHVGGDLYDFLPTTEGTLLSLFDVSGKGAPAALLAASLQGALRVGVRQTCRLPALASLLDEHLGALWAPNQFATAFFFHLQRGGRVGFLGAGHPPAVVVPRQGELATLRAANPPLGLVPKLQFVEGVLQLAVGDAVVAATDGLLEACNGQGVEFGLGRLQELLDSCRQLDLEHLVQRLVDALQEFTGQALLADDFTVVAFRRIA